MLLKYLILLAGVMCASSSVIFIKIGDTHPVMLTAYRQLLGSLFLLPIFLLQLKRHSFHINRSYLLKILLPASILAVHFISWIMGARMTTAANAALIVNMIPIAMPFVMYFLMNELITRREIAATCVALTGIFAMGLSDFNYNPKYALGDLICFVSMALFAIYLSFSRRNKDIPSIWLYVIPMYTMSGFFCLLLGLAMHGLGLLPHLIGSDLSKEWISIVGLAFFPTVLGHSAVNWAIKHVRGQTVALFNVWQFLFAGIMGFFVLREVPHALFYVAGVCVIFGTLIVLRKKS